jgi:uncharacterized protein with ParB-like and HNH nuclease domain
MAYETPITICKAIQSIQNRKFVLPAIQREYVWKPHQITMLFDSLMRDYPISTFLFWKVEKSQVQDYQFYEFLRNYHRKTAVHNPKIYLSGDEDVIAILDGQQRLTSIYVGLLGTYADKLPYYRWNSPHAFPKKKLYLNIFEPSKDVGIEYDFQFMTNSEIQNAPKEQFWFEVGKILEISDQNKLMMYFVQHQLMDTSKHTPKQCEYAIKCLGTLQNIIHQKGTISYYLEESTELDKVLQIFIRVNSGGTKLSYSDLLLSIATAQWNKLDAREVIHHFVDELNQIGDGFGFSKDFVLKACLVLGDFPDVRFKVDNFTKQNMLAIEKEWTNISNALRIAVHLVSHFGFHRDNLKATTAIIPIAYFILKNSHSINFLSSQAHQADRNNIRIWLIRVLLKGTFGGQPDGIYPVLRKLINEHLGRFPLEEIIQFYAGKRKSISFSYDDVQTLLDIEYGKTNSFTTLSLLYPGMNGTLRFHQDHIFPKSLFTEKRLLQNGIGDQNTREQMLTCYNRIGNLQLLQATTNIEKNNKPFNEWLVSLYKDPHHQSSFLQHHHIPANAPKELHQFLDFMKIREKHLITEFCKILGVNIPTLHEPSEQETEVNT